MVSNGAAGGEGIQVSGCGKTAQGRPTSLVADLPHRIWEGVPGRRALWLNCDRLWNLGGLRRFAFGLLDVDAALEEGAIFNADAGGSHVACQGTFGADVDAIGSGDIAADLAQNDDFTGVDGGIDLPIAADREAIAGQVDGAFDFAINIE